MPVAVAAAVPRRRPSPTLPLSLPGPPSQFQLSPSLSACFPCPTFFSLQADKFHKTGRQLRSKMWWQNMKMKLVVLFIILLIGVIIFCSVCFAGGKNCTKSSSPKPSPSPPEPSEGGDGR